MADPLSIAAIIGLVFAGKKLSESQSQPQPESKPVVTVTRDDSAVRTMITNSMSGSFNADPGLSSYGVTRREKYVQPNFGDIRPNSSRTVNGTPSIDFRDRPYVSGQMNNLAPSEKILVGPGLGVGPDVPSAGGFQQVYRVLPNNVGAYRLTQLPGRSGPAADVTGGAPAVVGQLGHNRPEKTAFLPDRRAPVPGRAQGQGGELTGVEVHSNYEKGKRMTNREETGLRTDSLNVAPAKRFVSGMQLAQDPTRNKGDLNDGQYYHVDNANPGIHSFVGAYDTTANDIRVADKRGNPDRPGNGGRMNVRANPLSQNGILTQVRAESNQQPIPSRNGGWTQQYVQPTFQSNNDKKGYLNPYASNAVLNTAARQLNQNPLAHTLASIA
jgi:hypothetical protein